MQVNPQMEYCRILSLAGHQYYLGLCDILCITKLSYLRSVLSWILKLFYRISPNLMPRFAAVFKLKKTSSRRSLFSMQDSSKSDRLFTFIIDKSSTSTKRYGRQRKRRIHNVNNTWIRAEVAYVNAFLFPDLYFVFFEHWMVFSIAVSALLHLTFAFVICCNKHISYNRQWNVIKTGRVRRNWSTHSASDERVN